MKKGLIAAGFLSLLLLTGTRTFAQKKGAGDAVKGKEVFDQCAVCHDPDTTEKKVGPGLKGLYKRDKLKNGKKVTDANVLAIINAGGNGMPSYSDMLSDTERADVVAYLKTL
jgi:cytochrome c